MWMRSLPQRASPGSAPPSAAPKRSPAPRHTRPKPRRGHATDAGDPASVLVDRLRGGTARRTGSSRPRPAPKLIVGLIPQALGPMPRRRARRPRRPPAAHRATRPHPRRDSHRRTRLLGPLPGPAAPRPAPSPKLGTPRPNHRAYRDRYGLNDDLPLGRAPATPSKRADAANAHRALIQAQHLAADSTPAHPARARVHEARSPQRSLRPMTFDLRGSRGTHTRPPLADTGAPPNGTSGAVGIAIQRRIPNDRGSARHRRAHCSDAVHKRQGRV